MPVLKVQLEPDRWIPVEGVRNTDKPTKPPTKTKHVVLPGTPGSYVSIAGLSLPSTTHRMVWEVRRHSWKGTEQKLTATKWNDNGPYGWWAAINADGSTHFRYSAASSPLYIVYVNGQAPTASLPPADEWIAWEQAFDDARCSTIAWCPVGQTAWPDPYSTSGDGDPVGAIHDASVTFRLGASGAGNYRNLQADIRQFALYDDKGNEVFTLDPDAYTTGANSWVTGSGHTATLSGGATITEDPATAP